MSAQISVRLLYLVSIVLATVGSDAHAQLPSASLASDSPVAAARPSITIQSPASGEIVQGVAIIRFRAENVSIESPFRPKEMRGSVLPSAHLHVTVDGTSWHWVHSTTDPVVITPLLPGDHAVTLELADANHRPLDVRTVRFTVATKLAAAPDHAGHR